MSTVLVTGSRGFIGGHLVKRLLECGVRVRCLVRRQSTASAPEQVESAAGDYLTGAGLREACAGVDVVIHLAGVTKALRRSEYEEGNQRAAEAIARAAASVPRFVHVSSLAAVGPATGNTDLDEDCEPHPVSEYGRSKLAGETAVRRLLPNAVVVRPPVVYGPGDTDVFEIFRSLSRGIDARLSRGENWFSAIYVADLVEGILRAAHCPGAAGKSYFLTHPEPVAWSRFMAAAAKILGRQPRTIVLPRAAAFAAGCLAEAWSRVTRKPGILSRDKIREAAWPRWTCSAARARNELGFAATTSIEDGIAASIGWYKEHGWL